jgi:peptidoglycan/LPS O-acetylase OafA/YrhL
MGVLKIIMMRHAVLILTIIVVFSRIFLDIMNMKPGLGFLGDIFGWPYLWTAIAPCFMAGMLGFIYRFRIQRSSFLFAAAILVPLLLSTVSSIATQAVFPFALAYLVFFVAFGRLKLPDARYGDVSYGTYLYGFPIQQMLVGAGMPFPLYVSSAIVFSLAAGLLSWWLVERHFVRRSTNEQHEVRRAIPAVTD